MAALITTADVIELCNLPDFDDLETKLEPHLVKSEKKLIALIGQAKYDELVDAPADDPDRQDAAHAQSLLTCYYAFPMLGLQPNERGGFTKQTGFDASLNTLMSKSELDAYRADYLKQALLMLDGLLLPETDADGNVTGVDLGGITFTAI